ncbi:MAG TPA: response regulator transcription factor [Candidatus Merdenecus merdavium]|nr:response regulator transcription factor [Candidatus Merdenecus merdavium]
MYRVAVVEDDPVYANQIEELIKRYEEEHHDKFDITVFPDGSELVKDYQSQFDLILMDIEMPKLNGMDSAEIIRKMDSDVVIIFITNMAQYAIQGYSVGALDFIMKPLNYISFEPRFMRALSRVKKRESGQILLAMQDMVVKLDTRQIYYVEVQNRMLHYHTEEGEFVLRGTIKDAQKELEPYYFFKCNYWYLVNLAHVSQVKKNMVIVAGHELEISRRNKTAFLAELTKYVGGV